MARTKRTDRKQPPQKHPRQTASLPASATEDSPSRRTRSCNSAAARTVERAIHDDSFHSNPGRDEIKYSDDESEYSNNTDDADTDDDKEDSDNDDEEYEDTDNEEEKFDDDRDNEEENENDYSKLLDSSLLEDEEPSVSYRVDWVKGKGAGRKPNKGRPPKPNTSNMTAVEAEHAIEL